VHHENKKPSGFDGRHRDSVAPSKLRQASETLTRIERKGEALSANADKLLRRVS